MNDGVQVSDTDLVIVCDGARSGLAGHGQNGILGSTLKKLTPKPAFKNIPRAYLLYFIQRHYRYLNHLARGSVIKHVDPEIFWNLQIPIPDENGGYFSGIINILSALEAVQDHAMLNVKLIKELKEATLQHCFRPR